MAAEAMATGRGRGLAARAARAENGRAKLLARLRARDGLRDWLRRWDAGSRATRNRMLEAFLREQGGRSGGEIEAAFGDGLSLLLARFTSAFRLASRVRMQGALELRAMALIVSAAPRGSYLGEILDSGTVVSLVKLIGAKKEEHPRLQQASKAAALEVVCALVDTDPALKAKLVQLAVLPALFECLSNSDSEEVHSHGVQLMARLARGNAAGVEPMLRTLSTLVRVDNLLAKRSVCSVLQRALETGAEDSLFFVSTETIEQAAAPAINNQAPHTVRREVFLQRLAPFVGACVDLLFVLEPELQQRVMSLVRVFLATDGLLGVTVQRLLFVMYNAQTMVSEYSATGGARSALRGGELMQPPYCVLILLQETMTGASSAAALSTLCHAGVVNAIVGSMLNIHNYEIQKLAIRLARLLCTSYMAAKEDVEKVLGDELVSRICASDTLTDGKIVRRFVQDHDLFGDIADELRCRGWDIRHQSGALGKENDTTTAADDQAQGPREGTANSGPEGQPAADKTGGDQGAGTPDEPKPSEQDGDGGGQVGGEAEGGKGVAGEILTDESFVSHELDARRSSIGSACTVDSRPGSSGEGQGPDEGGVSPGRLHIPRLPLSAEQLNARALQRWGAATPGPGQGHEANSETGEASEEEQPDQSMPELSSRKEDLYVPPRQVDPARVDSVMFAQFICHKRQREKDEDKKALEYIKGLPALEEKAASDLLETADDAIAAAEVEVLSNIPLKMLPEAVAATYLPSLGANDSHAALGLKARAAATQRERKQMEKKKHAVEIIDLKEEMRNQRELGLVAEEEEEGSEVADDEEGRKSGPGRMSTSRKSRPGWNLLAENAGQQWQGNLQHEQLLELAVKKEKNELKSRLWQRKLEERPAAAGKAAPEGREPTPPASKPPPAGKSGGRAGRRAQQESSSDAPRESKAGGSTRRRKKKDA